MLQFIHNNVVWDIDPNTKFEKTDPEHIVQSLGLIPTFITEDTDDVVKTALARYGFNLGGDMGGVVLEDGTYRYPGDPDLHPLTRCRTGGKTIFVYHYGMISFLDDETRKHVTYRFD